MKVAVFSTKSYDREFLSAANVEHKHDLVFWEPRLTLDSIKLAAGCPAICAFVNDRLDGEMLELLSKQGVRLIALRCAGYNHIDLAIADKLKMTVVRVPAYSPYAVAEHAVGLMLTLNRKLHKAYNRIREGNFALNGLLGFDFYGKTVGIIGTGKVGAALAKIMVGFGCRVIAHDLLPNKNCQSIGVGYVSLEDLYSASDIISLHCPLTPQTHHLIGEAALRQMRPGVMLINTGRGPLIDTRAVTQALKSGQIGYLGMDVYEEEVELFFEDRSAAVIQDDIFTRLLTFPNVVITGHQAFFTRNAMEAIARHTLENVSAFENDDVLANEVRVGDG